MRKKQRESVCDKVREREEIKVKRRAISSHQSEEGTSESEKEKDGNISEDR